MWSETDRNEEVNLTPMKSEDTKFEDNKFLEEEDMYELSPTQFEQSPAV